MLLFDIFYTTTSGEHGIKQFKAPKGKQYILESIVYWKYYSGDSCSLYILPYKYESVDNDYKNAYSPAIAVIGYTGVANTPIYNQINNINQKCKWISIAADNSSANYVWIGFYGKIIPLSETDAIWEYIGSMSND